MYTLLYRLYFHLKRVQKKHQLSSVQQKVVDYIEWYYNIWQKKYWMIFPGHKMGINRRPRAQKIIVSLTSHPQRIHSVWLTIETLLRQLVKPDEVILWLAESQFEGLDSLPERLLRLQARGLTIRFCEDLRSHKKYFYALQEYSRDLVILADDDLFYPRDTISQLLRLHRRWPDDICCITAEVIEPDFTSVPSLWRNPELQEHHWQHTDRIQAYTGSGTLIPPHALGQNAFDRDVFQKICPYADDLWISFMAHRHGTKLSTLKKWRAFPVAIYATAQGSLYYINGEGKQNDVQWKNLLEYYGAQEYAE